jgi:hypothetical protein
LIDATASGPRSAVPIIASRPVRASSGLTNLSMRVVSARPAAGFTQSVATVGELVPTAPSADAMFEVSVTIHPADRFTFSMQMERTRE